jgi:hypothetical protein
MDKSEINRDNVRRIFIAAALGVAALSGCAAHRSLATEYRFRRGADADLLTPPAGKDHKITAQAAVLLRKASADGARGKCGDISSDAFDLRWRGSSAEIHVKPDTLEAGSRIPLSVLAGVDHFRERLEALEAAGCLGRGGAATLIDRIIEEVSMPSPIAYYLRYGASASSGFVELRAPLTVKVITPVKDERTESRPVIGYQLRRYAVRPRANATGYELAPLSSETVIEGRATPNVEATPADAGPLKFPPAAQFFRLLFLQRSSSADHDSAMLAAPDSAALENGARIFQSRPQVSCDAIPAEVACMLFPLQTAVSAELPVEANGQRRYVHLAGTVRDALLASGESRPDELVGRLRVERPFGNATRLVLFDASKRDILSLVLIGGERLHW